MADRRIAAALLALVLLAGCGDDDEGATAERPTATTTTTTTTTRDAVVEWCGHEWAEVEENFQSGSRDPAVLDEMLDTAQAGEDLDNDTIATGSADIVNQLEWLDHPEPPAPDPAKFSDAIIMIGMECRSAE